MGEWLLRGAFVYGTLVNAFTLLAAPDAPSLAPPRGNGRRGRTGGIAPV
jgi:hypothetical protein